LIDLESPENCPRLVWFRSGLVRKIFVNI